MINGAIGPPAESKFGIASFTLPKVRPALTGGYAATKQAVAEHSSTIHVRRPYGTYRRPRRARCTATANSRLPLRIEMLIMLHTQSQLLDVGDGHGAHIHDYNLDSSGGTNIYYKGQGYKGTWSSTSRNGPLTFTLAGGQVLTLPPGLVWIDVTS